MAAFERRKPIDLYRRRFIRAATLTAAAAPLGIFPARSVEAAEAEDRDAPANAPEMAVRSR